MKIVTVLMILMFLALPVSATNSSHNYKMTHYLEAHIEGEWEFNHKVRTPAQGGQTVDLEGVGEAYIKSQLEIYSVTKVSSTWYDLC